MADAEVPETGLAASHDGARTVAGILSRLAWLAVLIAVPAAFYFFYVVAQFEAIQQRDLRVLAETSDAIEDITETAAKNLSALLADNLQSKPEVYDFSRPEEGSGRSDFAEEFFGRQAALVRADSLIQSCLQGRQIKQVDRRSFDPRALAFTVACTGKPREPDEGTAGDAARNETKGASDDETLTSTIARLDLDSVLRRVPLTSTLTKVVIVTDEGDVVAEHVPQPDFTLALGAEASTGLRIRSIDSLSALAGAGDAKDTSALTSRTALRHVNVAGVTYELACQPLRLRLFPWVQNVASDGPGKLSVCGFVSENDVRGEALQVAPTLLLVLVALTALGILSWPILKVLCMAPTERLRRGDAYFVLLGSLCIVVFATIAWLDSALYVSLRDRAITSLRDMARTVEANVQDELAAMKRQLCIYDRELVAYQGQLIADRDRDHTDLFLARSARNAETGFPGFSQPELPAVFDSFFWMLDTPGKHDGQQVIKGTVFRANTPALNLASRDYFQRVKRGRAWAPEFLPDCFDDSRPEPVYVQTARSLTTGEFFTALSMRSALRIDGQAWLETMDVSTRDVASEEGADAALVAAILSPMTSFANAALTPGLEISVIDNSGAAVFHTDPRRARAERIFRDEGVGERIRSVVNADVEQCFASNYRGQPRLLCVLPMQDLPWSIVVSQRQEPLLATNIETLASAATYALFYIGILVVLTAGFVFSETLATRRSASSERSRLSPRWVWPHLLPGREYWSWNGIGLLAIAAICLLARITESNWPLIALPLPAAAVILLVVTQRSVRRPGIAGAVRAPLGAYGAAAFLLWILIAVLPAVGIFHVAVNAELPRSVLAEQYAFVHRLEDRACAISAKYDRFAFDDASGPSRDTAAQEEIEEERGIYRLGLFAPDREEALCPGERWTRLHGQGLLQRSQAYLADLKPLYNETAVGLRYIGLSEDGGRQAASAVQRCGNVTRLALPETGQCGAVLEKAELGYFPRLALLHRPGLWLVALSLAALLGLFVRYTGHSLFFGALPPGRARRMADLLGDLPTRPTLAILSTRAQRDYWLEHSGLPVVDLSQPKTPGALERTHAVLVTGIDDLPCDSAEGRLRLRTLLDLVQQGVAVPIILSFRDKQQLRQEAGATPGTSGPGENPRSQNAEHVEDWLRLIDACDSVYVSAAEDLGASTDTAWYEHCFSSTCGAVDRLVLFQVATTGFANPKQQSSVQRLLDRGLLLRDPALGVADEGFRSHIRDSYDGETLEAALARRGRTNSRRVRWILAAILAAIILFLTTTQPDVVEVWLQFIVAASAGAAALLKASSAILGNGEK